jgi:hypothetical protein
VQTALRMRNDVQISLLVALFLVFSEASASFSSSIPVLPWKSG